ncbi:MAG TPA: alpha/beta fold hydrolase [Rudaea sp.]|nr:alpha/beta fold hydrolase [Rudaea sp.]
MSVADDFRPHRWLRNPHVQSLLASSGVRRMLFRRRQTALERGRSEHILDCGNGVRLQGFHTPQRAYAEPRALAVLLHGWEGSVDSTYMLHTGARLLAEGCDVFRLNFRDHGDTHHLNRELFHSCRIDEVVGAVKDIAGRFTVRPLVIAGFSLGGNFALRVALRAAAGIPLAWAFAVCPVISPRAGLASIESAPWFYERYFMHKWRGSLRRKQRLFPQMQLFSDLELRGRMRELTRSMVLRHTDFGSLENYLDGYSIAGETLAKLAIPATILTAADDPVIPVAEFRELALAPGTELKIVPHGGHCGFIVDLSLRSWAEDFLVARLERVLSSAVPLASGDGAALSPSA